MRFSVLFVSALCTGTLAYPTMPKAAAPPGDMTILADYFNMLASKVSESMTMSEAPKCDLSNAVLPVASPTPLPAVSEGLSLKHVAIGRGTQNYTCDLSNSTANPVATGALATLYNASCVASAYPRILALLPNTTLQFADPAYNTNTLFPTDMVVSGHHYFTNATTPTFNMDTDLMQLGFAHASKNNSVSAPADSSPGVNGEGDGAVAWLKLIAHSDATGGLQEIYRVNTAGGSPPATCVGAEAAFEVQYAAEYWFFQN